MEYCHNFVIFLTTDKCEVLYKRRQIEIFYYGALFAYMFVYVVKLYLENYSSKIKEKQFDV